MKSSVRIAAVGNLLAVLACGDSAGLGESDDGPGSAEPGTVLLVGSVRTAASCDTVGATIVQWQATRVGCAEAPPAPCTNPAEPTPIEGDRFACPQTDPTVLLGVELTEPGRYVAEAVLELTAEPARPECYGTNGVVEVVLTEEQVAAGGVIVLQPTGRSCP